MTNEKGKIGLENGDHRNRESFVFYHRMCYQRLKKSHFKSSFLKFGVTLCLNDYE